jgi:GT2 family glycosyltransferase
MGSYQPRTKPDGAGRADPLDFASMLPDHDAPPRASAARRLLRRLLGRPSSDWAGPDRADELARRARPIEDDHRCELVLLEAADRNAEPAAARLASLGHRVFRVRPEPAPRPGPFAEVRELAPRLFDVRLADPPFESLDRLRRDLGFGATAAAVFGSDARVRGLAERLRSERGWASVAADGELARDADALALAACAAFPLASIVVVTHQRRELTRLCLESLFARTEWPRYEVLVVDNGSTDGTPGLLEELARRRPSLRTIAFAENRGFPRACNAGLAEARGDMLVLLNNDTVLTRGWLAALHRHLSENPRAGLVGPVTNAIANEARIDVAYRDLDALPAWASGWTLAHDGEAFEIPSLAFFCVAIRREAFLQVGALDERFGLGLFEDGDYCRRARNAGWRLLCARDAFVHHWQNASFRRLGREKYFALYEENRRKFREKWGEGDPSEEQGR